MESSRPTRRVLYWDGIVDLKQLSHEYHAVIEKLLAGEYGLLSLEKLHGYDIYSVRINDTHRMLFTTAAVNNTNQLVILDIVLNHDYHKSRFLKPGVLRNYRELNGKAIENDVERQHFEKAEKLRLELDHENASEYEFAAAEYYTQRYIEFSDVQNNVVNVSSLPVVVNGAAGSGKSCVALSLICHYVLKHGGETPQRILYITQSSILCRNMYSNWMSLPAAFFPESKQVVFRSYEQLIQDECQQLKDEGFNQVFENDFVAYMRKRLKAKTVSRLIAALSPDVKYPEKIYQEFRIISGCKTLEDYKLLGKNQSLYQKNDREWLFSEYQVYLEQLANNKSFDLAFYRPKLNRQYDLVVVDETQDLSHLQIAVLRDLAVNRQICYCEDDKQSLTDNLPKKTFYSRLLDQDKRRTQFVQLPRSYRCPEPVLSMANKVSSLGARLVKQHFEPTTAHDEARPGSVIWHDALSDVQLTRYAEQAQSPEVAVITRKECVAEAKEKFKTELVFTTEQIKGLEYRTVIVFRLLDTEIYYNANEILASQNVVRPGNEIFSPAFNAVYTAFTRSTENLIIIEDQADACHKLIHIITSLRSIISSNCSAKPDRVISAVETREQWFKQGNYFLQSGDIDRSRDIFVKRVGMSGDEFEEYRTNYLKAELPAQSAVVAKDSTNGENNNHNRQSKINMNAPDFVKMMRSENSSMLSSYLIKLLSNPTLANLTALFKAKGSNFVLTKVPVNNDGSRCLLDILLNIETARPIILPNLLGHKLIELIRMFDGLSISGPVGMTSNIMPPLYWMLSNTAIRYKLIQQPEFEKLIVDHLTPSALVKRNENSSYPSILSLLAIHEEGVATLNRILDVHPECAKMITARDFFEPVGPAKNPLIMSYFLRTEMGKAFLQKLQHLNPDIYPLHFKMRTKASVEFESYR